MTLIFLTFWRFENFYFLGYFRVSLHICKPLIEKLTIVNYLKVDQDLLSIIIDLSIAINVTGRIVFV